MQENLAGKFFMQIVLFGVFVYLLPYCLFLSGGYEIPWPSHSMLKKAHH
jgi:hypothetical protein